MKSQGAVSLPKPARPDPKTGLAGLLYTLPFESAESPCPVLEIGLTSFLKNLPNRLDFYSNELGADFR
jgi:hypothetical protein